jgi:hypothetical protein
MALPGGLFARLLEGRNELYPSERRRFRRRQDHQDLPMARRTRPAERNRQSDLAQGETDRPADMDRANGGCG